MMQLFINSVEIDLKENIQIPISYYQADAKNPNKRKRSFSKDIVLPGTKNNNAFFMSAYNLNVSDVYGDLVGFDFDPTLRYPAILKRNGRTILSGTANLSKVITRSDVTNGRINNFYVNIFAEVTDWFQKLGDIKVSELDWSEYDFTLSVANIQATWTAPVGSGVWYPYIQYGFSQDPLKIQTNQLFLYVYVKEIVEKCAAYAGLNVTGSFFNEDPFNKLTWGRGGGELITISTAQALERLVSYTGVGSDNAEISFAGIFTEGLTFKTYFIYWKKYIFKDSDYVTITEVNDDLSQMNEDTGEVVIANTGNYNLSINSNITLEWGSTETPVTDQFYKNKVTLNVSVNGAVVATVEHLINSDTPDNETFDLNLEQPLNLSSGDILEVSFFNTNTGTTFDFGTGGNLTNDIDFNSISYSLTATDSIIVDGDEVNVSRFLPDTKAVDFMNDIITAFNLYLSDPDDEGNVILLPEGDYFLDTDECDIYTDKLDRGSDIEIMSASMIEGKTYKFKWAQDRDYYKKLYFDTYGQDYGDYDYNVPSTFKKGEKVYQLNSAQSCPVLIQSTDIVIPHIFQKDEASGVVKPHKGKPRFFFNNGTTATSTGWKLVNSDTLVATNLLVYPQAHHLDDIDNPTFDLNFGVPTIVYYDATAYSNNNLFYAYHAQFIRQLIGRDSKIVNAWFKLNENDFYPNFMRTLVNIDGVVYRKNAVKDWIANETGMVKVELLKILEGNSRNMQGLDSLPVGFEPVDDTVSGGGNTTTGGYQGETGDRVIRGYYSMYIADTSSSAANYTIISSSLKQGAEMTFINQTGGNALTITGVLTNEQVPAYVPKINGSTNPLELPNANDSVTLKYDGANFTITAATGTLASDHHSGFKEIDTNEIVTIEPNKQMTNWNGITNNGTLDIQGDLILK